VAVLPERKNVDEGGLILRGSSECRRAEGGVTRAEGGGIALTAEEKGASSTIPKEGENDEGPRGGNTFLGDNRTGGEEGGVFSGKGGR